MSVVLARTGGDPTRLRRLGPARFEAAVRREIVARQGKKPCLRIVRLLFAAAADLRGVTTHRRGALERVQFLLDDFRDTGRRQTETEARMVEVLDELQLTELVCSIVGLSALGAATILAETGDLTRFASARSVVKHSGLAPREKSSGTYTGRTRLTGQGRPGLRRAAWRAVWGAQKANPVYAAKFTHLTTRTENKLNRGQAHAALAAAILRQLYAVVSTGQRWDAAIAAGGRCEVIEPAA
jgi:transposase